MKDESQPFRMEYRTKVLLIPLSQTVKIRYYYFALCSNASKVFEYLVAYLDLF